MIKNSLKKKKKNAYVSLRKTKIFQEGKDKETNVIHIERSINNQ